MEAAPMRAQGSQASPRDLQPRYVPTICGEPFVPTAQMPAQSRKPRPLLYDVADTVCLQMDARTAAVLGEAWSQGAALMQKACQSQKKEMLRMQAEVHAQVSSMKSLASETRQLREGIEAVLQNVGLLTAAALEAKSSDKPHAAEPPAAAEEGLRAAAPLPAGELPEPPRTPTGRGTGGHRGEAVEDLIFQTPQGLDPSEALDAEAPARAPAASNASLPQADGTRPPPSAAAPQQAAAAPRQAHPNAAILLARAAALRAAAREVGLAGPAGRPRLAAGVAVPEAGAPLLAPMPRRAVPSAPQEPPRRLASWPEEREDLEPADSGADSCQGASRASTPSTSAGEAFGLTLRRVDSEMPFGLEVRPDFHARCLVVEGVRPGGVCEAWNRQNLGELRELRPCDRITSVNGVSEAEAMRDEFRQRLTVRLQVERGETAKALVGSSTGDSTGRSSPDEAVFLEQTPQPAPNCGPAGSGPSPAGPPAPAKSTSRPHRTRGGRGRRGRGGKA